MVGFTYLHDILIEKYGLTAAAIYGSVERYSKMRNEVCYASQATIGEKVGLKRKTAHQHVNTLVRDGYLEELESPKSSSTKYYRPTDKAAKESEKYRTKPKTVYENCSEDKSDIDYAEYAL